MILYRPVGLEELSLIYDSDFSAFPPRLPEQPIFYPVLNSKYAEQIAKDWNTKSNSFAGYVTRFSLQDEYSTRFERRVVGSTHHEELWVPAEELDSFNHHIEGPITVDSAFFGDGFRGFIPHEFGLKGKSAIDQLKCLAEMLECNSLDFDMEISENAKAAFLNYHYWRQLESATIGLVLSQKEEVLGLFRKHWNVEHPDQPLI